MSGRRRAPAHDGSPSPSGHRTWGEQGGAQFSGPPQPYGAGEFAAQPYADAGYAGYPDHPDEPGDHRRGRRRSGRSSDAPETPPTQSRARAQTQAPNNVPTTPYGDPAAYDDASRADRPAYAEPDDDYYGEDERPKRRWLRRRADDDEDPFAEYAKANGYDSEYHARGYRSPTYAGDADSGFHEAAHLDYADVPEPRRQSAGRGDQGPPDEEPGRHKGGSRKSSGLSPMGWISVALTAVLVLGTLTAYKIYRDTFGLIKRGSSTDELDKNRPVNQTGAINVLLVGSDTRAGDNKRYGQHMENAGERTDTIMLLHVSPNRDNATLLSFPRDSMVLIPQCKNVQNGVVAPAHLGMINSAFSDGGMICTRRTIESLTGIPIDHYVKVDFTGFKNIVNALGGIEICLPQDVNDKLSKLTLAAGRHKVKGETALAYVRLRHGLGDGSDISRIKRQQVFIQQVVKEATSKALLTDIGRLRGFIAAAAQSVTMDDQLDTESLISIAQSAQKLTSKGFKSTTVPWEPYIGDKNRVQWKQPAANNLFAGIKSDVEVTPSATPSAAASKPAGPVVKEPSQVKIQVFNGTNTTGKAKEVAEQLAAQGFKITGIGDARKADGTDQPASMIRYAGQGWNYAKMLQSKLLTTVTPETGKLATGPTLPFTPASPPPTPAPGKVPGPVIQLVIGADWKGVKVPLAVGEDAVTSQTDICSS